MKTTAWGTAQYDQHWTSSICHPPRLSTLSTLGCKKVPCYMDVLLLIFRRLTRNCALAIQFHIAGVIAWKTNDLWSGSRSGWLGKKLIIPVPLLQQSAKGLFTAAAVGWVVEKLNHTELGLDWREQNPGVRMAVMNAGKDVWLSHCMELGWGREEAVGREVVACSCRDGGAW